MTSSRTHDVVLRVIAHLLRAIATNASGCFQLQELRAVSDNLKVVAARNLPEATYNARVRLLVAGLIDLARSRDIHAASTCPVMPGLLAAFDELLALARNT